jgi:hypothetical protein
VSGYLDYTTPPGTHLQVTHSEDPGSPPFFDLLSTALLAPCPTCGTPGHSHKILASAHGVAAAVEAGILIPPHPYPYVPTVFLPPYPEPGDTIKVPDLPL